MSIRKTQRKNKTKQVISWPAQDSYFTIDDLVKSNPHMLTAATPPSDITLRVRLSKAITEENLVAIIGQRNCGKGRPKLVFAMRPVKQSVIDKAKTDGISLDMPKIMPVLEVSTTTQPSTPAVKPVTNIVLSNQAINA